MQVIRVARVQDIITVIHVFELQANTVQNNFEVQFREIT